jgi:tetratricopeptide (TPR) repeat protein
MLNIMKIGRCLNFMLIALNLVFVSNAFAAEESELLRQAEELYLKGEFAEAAEKLETRAATGSADPRLLYNLGNAYFKSKQLGPAMAAYVGALSLDPSDADLRANIRFAEKSLQDKLSAFRPTKIDDYIFFWVGMLNERTSIFLISALVSIALIVLALQWVMERYIPALVIFKWSAALLALIGLSGHTWRSMRSEPMGAVISDLAEIYSAPTRQAGQKIFELHAGSPFWIQGISGNWMKITISDGKTGWVQDSDVRFYQ